MNISGITHTALSGMSKQANRLSEIAGNIANGSASVASTDADLATQLTDLVEVAQIYKANATVFETGADLWEILGSIKRD